MSLPGQSLNYSLQDQQSDWVNKYSLVNIKLFIGYQLYIYYAHLLFYQQIVVQLLSCVRFFVTPWTAAHQAPLSSTISQSLLKFMLIASVMLSDHLILCYPLFLLPSIFLSIRVFSNQSALWNRWPKYWSFSPSNEYSGLISFRIDWFDLLALQGALKSLL